MRCSYPQEGPAGLIRECGRRAVVVFARDAQYARCRAHSGTPVRRYADQHGYRVVGLVA